MRFEQEQTVAAPFRWIKQGQLWLGAIALLAAGVVAATSQGMENGQATATIVGQATEYATIQDAIDAAPEGAVIELSPGRFDERITIAKSVRLVGAGADKTIIGPTAEGQAALRESYEKSWKSIEDAQRAIESLRPRRECTEAEAADFKEKYETVQRSLALYIQPVIEIDRSAKAELRSLKVTMPDTPQHGGGLKTTSAILVKGHAGVGIDGCVVAGCLAGGIGLEEISQVEIVKSLVAGCWGAGLSGPTNADGRLSLHDCDVRNNYHYNVSVGVGTIENCRISGSAWSGVSGGAARVEGCAIFDNARSGIYSVGKEGIVKNNLVYRNGSGMGCWAPTKPLIEANLFLDNATGAIYVGGPCEPAVRRNLIVGSPLGVRYGPMKIAKGEKPPATEFQIEGTLFWRVEMPAALFKSNQPEAPALEIELKAEAGNREVDPLTVLGADDQIVFAKNSPVDSETAMALSAISMRSSWALTPEEQLMIPEDGTRDWEKWKMRPKDD